MNITCLKGYCLHCPVEVDGTPTTNTGKWSTLDELGPLLHLRNLSLSFDVTSNSFEARAARLTEKSHLTRFFLSCGYNWMDKATELDIKRIKDISELLQPPTCLDELRLEGYPCSRLPHWMTAMELPNLTRLLLKKFKYCENLSSLGELPNLAIFHILEMPSINTIGPEFMGTSGGRVHGNKGKHALASTVAFPKLEHLEFHEFAMWENWQWESKFHAMPCLQELLLVNCPKLITIPEGLSCHVIALKLLLIREADSLGSNCNSCSLQKLKINRCSSLKRISDLPALEKLLVIDCPSLNVVESLSSLQFMKIYDFEMKSLPEWLLESEKSPKPEKLEIYCCEDLFIQMCEMDEEEWPKILHLNHVEIHNQYEGEYAEHVSYTREPFSFTTFTLDQ
ncbi:uncharacterized protein A4U43_C07F5060 [Asparagus officinalis]|uniref:R13L1/DRL21-like LRR repeat region domain-containing protein n=1 Tax=Asparagus officinalis TaxID=4686 RepID=A0A5P1E9K6_ASPOF|nr:uncharacterized protein A4U43_C07F5060 [Asparagus officinalis]